MPKSKCFLDTSVLVNAAIKFGPDNVAAIGAISKYSECQIPAYALKEFKVGVLSYYYWLYRKFVETKSAVQTFEAVVRLSATPRRNMAATALRAYQELNQELNQFLLQKQFADLQTAQNPSEALDRLAARVMTLELKRKIISGWSNSSKYGVVVDKLSCYSNEDLKYDSVKLDIDPKSCHKGTNCACAEMIAIDLGMLKKIQAGLLNAPAKPETTRRKEVVRDISLRGGGHIIEKECRSIGDAYFIARCPPDCDLLTTNRRDVDPLAAQTGTTVTSP